MFRAFFAAIFNFIRQLITLVLWLIIAAILVVVVLIIGQVFHVFPALIPSLLEKSVRDQNTLPPGVRSVFITTEDGEKIEVWKLSAEKPDLLEPRKVALILHGNNGPVDQFFPYQKWFQSLGITSYLAEYRGIGKSTGWPSENGVYVDAGSVFSYLLGQEEVKPKDVIVLGISLGAAPAALLAKSYEVDTLILLAPFLSVPELIREHEYLRYLERFLWYRFPTRAFVKDTAACVIMAHGKEDKVVPISHMQTLEQEFTGKGPLYAITSEQAGHNNLLPAIRDQLSEKLTLCLDRHAQPVESAPQPDPAAAHS